MAWIETINGIALPAPALGSGSITISTIVDGERNGNGEFIGQVVGEDKLKIACQFAALRPDEMMTLLKIFDRQQGGSFVNTFRVFDPRKNDFVYMEMYIGDRTGTPYIVNPLTMRPAFWNDVQANLIQV